MPKKLMLLNVRGDCHEWGFHFYGDPAHLEEWRADGLDIVEVESAGPMWVSARLWCFFQDLFNFRNPFRR